MPLKVRVSSMEPTQSANIFHLLENDVQMNKVLLKYQLMWIMWVFTIMAGRGDPSHPNG